jgi:hypothetical protein
VPANLGAGVPANLALQQVITIDEDGDDDVVVTENRSDPPPGVLSMFPPIRPKP